MDRGSDKHSARVDDELAREVRDIVQGVGGTRADDGRVPESPADGEPEVSGVLDDGETDELSRFGRYIGRSALPGDREKLRQSAETLLAPDDVLAEIDRLPADREFATVTEIWAALGH
ncbi:DUF2795 domain-containing protein [Actinoplanes bogorensis]|uniref:DUF2795 domain-containing protein n=1 Tax=Paractinoplanes bogorensis TaxID=1610840 RepID=A0ABS5Z7Q9_9ACTN|nr:DUF2795 domain-containing protein [Actinoplanes bogorensis]MBU2670515.1 DUF2795 domain-containing protein [Actinoplanes bogorensis]